jgi:hypothetical protein
MGGFRTTRRKPSEHNSLLQQLKDISNSNTLEWRNFTQDFRIPGTTEQQESSELPRIRAGQAETGRRGRRRRGMGARRSPHRRQRGAKKQLHQRRHCGRRSKNRNRNQFLDPNYYRITRTRNGRKIRRRNGL